MNINHILRVQNLHLVRHDKLLMKNISFEVQSGDILIIHGPNGVGKSTLLRLLAGLLPVSDGQLWWQPAMHRSPNMMENPLHYLGHANGLKLDLTVSENIQLAALHTHASEMPPITTLLCQLGLPQDLSRRARDLSAGQKRQLALVRLLLKPKPLWLLDEPFTALDTTAKKFWRETIESHARAGGIVIMSTHEPMCLQHTHPKYLRLDRTA